MKNITLTCPFTGCSFKALEDADKNLYFTHPLTGESLRINYNTSIKKYNVPASFFKPIELCTFTQAAEILGVSRQRISTIAATNTIRPVLADGKQVFIMSDVIKYKQTRKPGAPRKEI